MHNQANVMLAYPIPEAETLLTSKLEAARASLSNCEEDLDFLREQITVRLTFVELSPRHSLRLTCMLDDGSCNSKGLQLGCRSTTEGQGWCRGLNIEELSLTH